MELTIEIEINLLLIGVKLNALKLALGEKELEIYNNRILEQLEKVKPNIMKLLPPEQADEVLRAFLK